MIRIRLSTLFVVSLLLSSASMLSAQTLFTVGGDSVSVGEFRYAYSKARRYSLDTSRLTVDDFLRSYITFRLKVADACDAGLDSLASFQMEYQKYREAQLSPHLLDSAVREEVYQKAYLRMQREVDASHILLRVLDEADAPRMLARIDSIRTQLLRGASFAEMARRYSDDPTAAKNGGRIGYFGAFTLIHPFELAAYATKPSDISQPVRTKFGYHLIFVHDIRPSQGQMRVAHIMKSVLPDFDSAQVQKVYEEMRRIEQKLRNGEEFAELATQESDDHGTAAQGGLLPWVSPGRFPPEFVKVVFSLREDGEISPIFRTEYAYHIVRRVEHRPVGAYDDSREYIRAQLARAGIELEGSTALRRMMRQRVDAHLFPAQVVELARIYRDNPPAEVRLPDSLAQVPFVRIGSNSLRLRQLEREVLSRYPAPQPQAFAQVAEELMDREAERQVLDSLYAVHPDLEYLLREFYNGLLLFDISERRLWQGNPPTEKQLRKLYKQKKRKLKFQERYTVEEYLSASRERLVKLRRELCQASEGKASKRRLQEDSVYLQVKNYEGNVALLDGYRAQLEGRKDAGTAAIHWDGACSEVLPRQAQHLFYRVTGMKRNVRKTFQEAHGELQTIYQKDEEERWINDLRQRYPVQIHQKQLDQLKKEFTQ